MMDKDMELDLNEVNSNLLDFADRNNNIKFVKIPVYIDWAVIKGEIIEKQFCVLGLKNKETGTEVIHNLSSFIISKWWSNDYNTQKKHCENIVKFLNWVLENQRYLKINSLSDLTLEHGTKFLSNFLTEGISKGTVQSYESTLKEFYFWLSKQGVIESIPPEKMKIIEGKFGEFYESPFENVIYPPIKRKDKEHLIPIRYIPLFLEIAIIEAPRIAFGVYAGMFGGFRPSEAVNTKRTQLQRQVESGNFLVNLSDQNFRSDLKNSSGGGFVKKQRSQMIYQINDWGDSLFRDHCKLYKCIDGTDALFVNARGKAMTYASYYQYFKKVKDRFIDFLKYCGSAQDKIVGNSLERRNWNAHIGRGTFTNLLADEVTNPFDMAFLRGDDDLLASLSYMVGTSRYRDKMNLKFKSMHQDYVPRLIQRSGKG